MQNVAESSTSWNVARWYRLPRSSFASASEAIGAPFTAGEASAGRQRKRTATTATTTTQRLDAQDRSPSGIRADPEEKSDDSEAKEGGGG